MIATSRLARDNIRTSSPVFMAVESGKLLRKLDFRKRKFLTSVQALTH